MPFGTITSRSSTYEPRDVGVYSKTGTTFSSPDDSYIVRGATKGSDVLRASVSRVLQKDVVVGGATKRLSATVTLSIVTPPSDFTPAELDDLATDLSNFVSADTVSRMLLGEK